MRRSGIIAFFLLPSLVFAAGFAKQSIFLSQDAVTEGETVSLYAVVQNDSSQTFNGVLRFSDESGPIGTSLVSMKPGVASTVSVSWAPKAGTHEVVANLEKPDGTVVESENASFFVNNKPTAASTNTEQPASAISTSATTSTQNTVESSQPLQQWVASTSPAVAKFTAPVFSTLDSGRTLASKKLAAGSDWSKNNLAKAAHAPSGWLNTLWLIVYTATLYACAALSYLIDNIGIFYPCIALVFFYILWRLSKMARRR